MVLKNTGLITTGQAVRAAPRAESLRGSKQLVSEFTSGLHGAEQHATQRNLAAARDAARGCRGGRCLSQRPSARSTRRVQQAHQGGERWREEAATRGEGGRDGRRRCGGDGEGGRLG